MENERKYIIDGYRFEDEKDYNRARNELTRISDIKKINDLRDEASLRRVYDALVETEELVTPIGIGFLREVQKNLLQNPEQKKTMNAIPIKHFSDMEGKQSSVPLSTNYKSLYEEGREKLRNLRIILTFSIIIIVVIFAVTVFDRNLTPEKAREAVLNEYASWKEELTEKENELRAREKELKEKELKEKEELMNQKENAPTR